MGLLHHQIKKMTTSILQFPGPAKRDTIKKHESMGKITFDSDSSSASSSPAPGEDKHQPSVSASVTLAQLHPGQRHQASHKTAKNIHVCIRHVIRYANI